MKREGEGRKRSLVNASPPLLSPLFSPATHSRRATSASRLATSTPAAWAAASPRRSASAAAAATRPSRD